MDLLTNAERQADKARELPNFKNISLPGIHAKVTEMLGLIGRTDGIFSTYTFHDISHVDAMLKMLDWLIPPSTSEAMTSADWLMIVLSIYFHDLGMIVTSAEYEKRNENRSFRDWFDSLDKTTEGQDYLSRTKRMSEKEMDRFFFQEFVRLGHAARIREWITGRHSRTWGPEVKPISEAISKLLEGLPSRFREQLGIVCESHHLENLDNATLFPLCARYGGDQQEIVNAQYIAILLRTTDLLHVTKDRTPSLAYKILGLSDPKAVSEWDKQLGTFAVGPKGRLLIEGDSESAIIVVHADFIEEQPLFALQEYIAYSHEQIKQSKRWVDKSQETVDGKDYSFPWHTVKSDVRLEGVPPQPLRFELDRGRLLDLLVGHTIYNDPTVAVRELLQNSIDAIRYQHYLDSRQAKTQGLITPPIGKVIVKWDPSTRFLVVEDNGIGMDRDIINHHLMSVGASFYDTPQFEIENREFTPISRFGIGILTCFMISDDIEIVTVKDSKGYRIRMTSVKSSYLLRELELGDYKLDGLEPHGTRVKLRIRDTVKLPEGGIVDIVKYWVILPECSVEFIEHGKSPVKIGFDSPTEALRYWLRSSHDDFDKYWITMIEFITKTRQLEYNDRFGTNTGSYEMGFAVKCAITLERSFFSFQRVKTPLSAVCIEGIRVSDSLPWFGSHISSILSVRGDRNFRTTVSRQGLEQDEHYDRIGKLCTEMLFEHIKDEITRISEKDGRPLSQASSASLWLYSSLLRAIVTRKGEGNLDLLYKQLPSMVVERFQEREGKPETSRTLISYSDLLEEKEFWTIESRLVDSLGTISRDLGRELSLNEFLIALAPDFKKLQYSPLIPDAQLFAAIFYKSHKPQKAEFSVQHQQAAVKWVRFMGDESMVLRVEKICNPDFLTLVQQKYAEKQRIMPFYAPGEIKIIPLPAIRVEIAEIMGDDINMQAVVTRIGTIIRPDSELSNIWLSLRDISLQLANKPGEVDNFISSYMLSKCFSMVIEGGDRRSEIRELWRINYDYLQPKIKDLKFEGLIPRDLTKLLEDVPIFKAVSYWRDWFKME